MPAHLIVTFDSDKIIVMLSYDLLYGLIMPNLKLELFRRKLPAVIMNFFHMLFQPGHGFIHLFLRDRLANAQNFGLIQMLNIDAELFLPVLHTDHCAVHPKAPSTDQSVFLSVELGHNGSAPGIRQQLVQDRGFVEVSGHTIMLYAKMVECTAGRKHCDHPGPIGIQICGKDKGAFPVSGRNGRKIGEGEHAIGEYCNIHTTAAQQLGLFFGIPL